MMDVFANYRQSGKTTKLIERSAKTGEVIVTYNMHMKSRIREMARVMGLKIPNPITHNELICSRYKSRGIKLLIDDVEMLIYKMLPDAKIGAITLSYSEYQNGTMVSKEDVERYNYLKSLE